MSHRITLSNGEQSTPDSFSTIADILVSAESRKFSANMAPAGEWGDKQEKRFEELTRKEALDAAMRDELKELDHLQELRRRFAVPATGEEILYRHELRKLDHDTLDIARRYTRFVPNAAYR